MIDRSIALNLPLVLLMMLAGCGPATMPDSKTAAKASATEQAADATQASVSDATASKESEGEVFEVEVTEASADDLLAARLPIEQTTDGWIRLFDGHTFFGWTIAGKANFKIVDQTLTVDRGAVCLCATSTQWSDFELEVEYLADANTNSGIFIRTPYEAKDPAADCFEINIAPPDNPFPTGGIVQRKKADPIDLSAEDWHTMNIVADGPKITVSIDGTTVTQFDQADTPRTGHIGLQHNSGKVSFRNVRLRPIGLKSLLDDELTQWQRYPDMPGKFEMGEEGLSVDGGKQQLESKETYGDFVLHADVEMADAKSNSGIFFRAIPGDVMMGYECQVSNEIKDDNPMLPADCGIGGIFKRQDARIVAGEPGRLNSIVLVAQGNHMASWVNGLQVMDVYDDRAIDENPRKGLRLDPGTIMIQGHDPTTQALYRKLEIAPAP